METINKEPVCLPTITKLSMVKSPLSLSHSDVVAVKIPISELNTHTPISIPHTHFVEIGCIDFKMKDVTVDFTKNKDHQFEYSFSYNHGDLIYNSSSAHKSPIVDCDDYKTMIETNTFRLYRTHVVDLFYFRLQQKALNITEVTLYLMSVSTSSDEAKQYFKDLTNNAKEREACVPNINLSLI